MCNSITLCKYYKIQYKIIIIINKFKKPNRIHLYIQEYGSTSTQQSMFNAQLMEIISEHIRGHI